MKKKVAIFALLLFMCTLVFAEEIRSLVGKKAPFFLLETYDQKKVTNRSLENIYYAFILEGRKGESKNNHVRKRIESFISMLPANKKKMITFFAVADVYGYLSFLYPMIRNKIKANQLKQGVRILCDFKGHILKRFKLKEDYTNFVLVDNKGIVKFAYRGIVPYFYLDKVSNYLSKEFDASYTNAPIDISPGVTR